MWSLHVLDESQYYYPISQDNFSFSDSFSLSTPLDDFKIFKLQKSDSREDKQNERMEELKTRGVREGTGSLY